MVAGARPSLHGAPAGHYDHRDSVRLGAFEARRHRAVADWKDHRARMMLQGTDFCAPSRCLLAGSPILQHPAFAI